MQCERTSLFREIGLDRADEFCSKGYRRTHFFPHRIYYLPKCGPDAYLIALRQWSDCHPEQMWEVVIYADQSLTKEFPADLFFDDDIIWHQQQFGKVGQVATANLVVRGSSLYSTVHVSDLVQRISRKRDHKTRVEHVFKGWNRMLLNSVLNFARENNLSQVHIVTSESALRNSDPTRNPGKELFQRLYDRNVQELFKAHKSGGWWCIDVNQNRDRIVVPQTKSETIASPKVISVCHDIERGFGHFDTDLAFALRANEASDHHLNQMLAIEEKSQLKATYNVMGQILHEVKERITKNGHCLGFHSYDHRLSPGAMLQPTSADFGAHRYANVDHAHPHVPDADPRVDADIRAKFLRAFDLRPPVNHAIDQLERCRRVDYRLKGYRPPQSKITPELTDDRLLLHNFEWLASSSYSLHNAAVMMSNGLVKFPILFDDFDLYDKKLSYENWERQALESIKEHSGFVAFSLHDCYAQFWLPHYEEFLEKIKNLAEVRTLNQVAAEEVLCNAK